LGLDDFQERLQIQFSNPDLLRQALTHRSFANENDEEVENNERLEFLGDAILDFLTADMLYRRFPEMPEGEMTRLRAALVRTESLAQIATDCGLGEVILVGKGEANTGGRTRVTNLCSGFEAVIGAIYLDQGLEAVRDFIIPRLTELQKDVMEDAIRKDPRSQFQEWAQAEHGITPEFRTVGTEGPEHKMIFEVELLMDGQVMARGFGKSKRVAAQHAASTALKDLRRGDLEYMPQSPSQDQAG
jgi:ribonuclease-3